ncbi:DUF3488 domain-containing transglutaminase family protein [Pseudoalteromonas sp. MMG005]|nr:DUF3488 domain-containing transglutaminase family protein [Pseudoalteromonas sp. MMG005]
MNTKLMIVTVIYVFMSLLLISELGIPFTALIGSLAIWHLFLWKYKTTSPSNTALNVLAVIGMVILLLSIGVDNSVSLFVSLMVLACQLKVIQAQSQRQFQQITTLNFFTIPCLFLFSQSLYMTLIVLCSLGINLGLMIALSHRQPLLYASKDAFKKLILILPISALLVIFLPKLPAFWQLPGPSLAKTGLSEDVNPFNIAQLSQSDELAFRAIIDDKQRFNSPFYWRAIIHDKYDGASWLKSNQQNIPLRTNVNVSGAGYRVIAESSNLPWLFSLGTSVSYTGGVSRNQFGTLFRSNAMSNNFEYQAFSYQQNLIELTRWEYRKNTQFPNQLNKRAQTLAQQWDTQSSTTAAFIKLMKQYFISNNYRYTLTPAAMMNENTIDEFLFEQKAGFCGHYASSVAMMMRSVGIPTRLVSGYLGGEYSVKNNYYSVYQYDAHAWVEYYTPGQGWQAIDPTAWVSPERLLGSLSQHSSLSAEFQANLGISLVAFTGIPGVQWLRLKLEEYDYQWTRWVLNFDESKQRSFLEKVFGKSGRSLSGVVAIIFVTFTLIAVYWYMQRPSKVNKPTAVVLFERLSQISKYSNLNMSPYQLIEALKHSYPEQEVELEQFYQDFSSFRYQGKSFSKTQRISALKLIKSIKRKTKRDL